MAKLPGVVLAQRGIAKRPEVLHGLRAMAKRPGAPLKLLTSIFENWFSAESSSTRNERR